MFSAEYSITAKSHPKDGSFARWYAHPVWFLFLFGVMASAQTQTPSFTIGFPIHDLQTGEEVNPYAAPIVSVVDHYAKPFGKNDANGPTVWAYTGEQGEILSQCAKSPCGSLNSNFLAPKNGQSDLHFYANGKYVGATDDAPNNLKILNYRGHSGIDYNYGEARQVYAAHDGDLFVPAQDPILDCVKCNPPVTPTTFNTFYIRDASGWSTWYLHTESGPFATTGTCLIPGLKSGQKLLNGDTCIGHVHRRDLVATVGKTGVGSFHLHFEVRAACDFGGSSLTGCRVVDPYGWEWLGNDPLGIVNPAQGMSNLTPLWDLSTWNLTEPQVSSAVISASGNLWTLTLNGSQFDSVNPNITLWHATSRYCFVCGAPQSPATISIQSKSTTQITAQVQIVDPSVSLSPDLTSVKVANDPNGPNGPGPRSPAKQLSLLANNVPGPKSYSLLLYKTPAPGGGVFLGFGGFHSATNSGHVIFNSGVDLNRDNIPDIFPDFDAGPSGISQVAFAGFTQILNTLRDDSGDIAFSGVNQAAGRTGAGIYFVPTGATSPVKVAQPGDACPSPCPVMGPVFMNVSGPFAIGESGEVVFSAELNGPSPTPTWVLYLFSPSNGSYTKIAADGVAGDVTPVGGFFTSQNNFASIGIVPSTGDVIFSDLVTNGASTGGIFKFSRSAQKLSKLVAQGDPAPPGVTGTLGMPLGSVGGQHLAFYASVTGGNTTQVIGLIPDTNAPSATPKLVAFEGEPTATIAGGRFDTPSGNPPLPFAFFGQGQGAPLARDDGSVVFASELMGAMNANGSLTDQGIFFWDGKTISKIVVDGDPLNNGKSVQGVLQFVINALGDIYYFATTEN